MANNRLILYHRPTGHYVYLGKRMDWGWYNPPERDKLLAFYQRCADDMPQEGDQDDFILLAENRDENNNPFIHSDWSVEHNPDPSSPEEFIITLSDKLAFKPSNK
jgi:hypothetical protein